MKANASTLRDYMRRLTLPSSPRGCKIKTRSCRAELISCEYRFSVSVSFCLLSVDSLVKMESQSPNSLLGTLGLGDATNQILLEDFEGLLTHNAFLDGLPQVGDGDIDVELNDGNDMVLDTAMLDFLGDVEQTRPARKTANKLESLLRMPPSTVTKNKRAFYEAVRSDQPSKKAKGSTHQRPNNVRGNGKSEVPTQTIVGGGGGVYSPISAPEIEMPPPISAPVDNSTDRPLSPIIGGGRGRRRRSAVKAVKKTKKIINVEPASTSSSAQRDSSGSSASGVSADQMDWSGFSASQRDVFSRAFEKQCTVKTLLDKECRALQRHESELAELRQKVQDAENRVEHSKTIISRYNDNLLFLRKTFSD